MVSRKDTQGPPLTGAVAQVVVSCFQFGPADFPGSHKGDKLWWIFHTDDEGLLVAFEPVVRCQHLAIRRIP